MVKYAQGNSKPVETSICNICLQPATIDEAKEIRRVPSNVQFFSHLYFTVWRCVYCNSLHSKEVIGLDEFYSRYPYQDHKLNFPTRLAYQNRLAPLQSVGVKTSDLILDYGCGSGLFVRFLHEKGFKNARGFDSYVKAFRDYAALSVVYDCVVAQDVIEHTNDPIRFMDTMRDLIKPNGVLVIGTPRAEGISIQDTSIFVPELHQPYHRHILSECAFVDIALRCGFKIERIVRRYYWDTLFPGVNTKSIWHHVQRNGGHVDALLRPPTVWDVAKSPRFLWYALTGYFSPPESNMLFVLRKRN